MIVAIILGAQFEKADLIESFILLLTNGHTANINFSKKFYSTTNLLWTFNEIDLLPMLAFQTQLISL